MPKLTPPEGYIYDNRTGYYYTQEIERDETGKLIQHVKWFDPQTGSFTENFYDIPDDYEPSKYKQDRKPVPMVVIIGVIGVIVLAVIIIAVVLVLKKKPGTDKDKNAENNITTENTISEDNDVVDNDMTTEKDFDESTSEYSGVQVDSHDYIRTTGKSPLDSDISGFSVLLMSPNDNGFIGMIAYGTGEIEGEFLVNPAGRSNGAELYTWDFFFSDKVGVRVYGLADYGDYKEAKYVSGKDYLRAAVISRDGDAISVHEEIPFGAGPDGFSVDSFDLRKYDENINPYDITTVEIITTLGDYRQSGERLVTVMGDEGEILFGGDEIINESSSINNDSVIDETIYEEEQWMGSGVDLHSSGMPGFKHAGAFECTDKSLPADALPRINLEDDGYCELFVNLGDGCYKFQGYYEYKSSDSGYDAQGGETYIYMHFPGNSDDISYAELLYDGGIDDGYIYFLTYGFGLMGGDSNFAGYFSRIY